MNTPIKSLLLLAFVLLFLSARAQNVSDILEKHRLSTAPDKRTAVWDVTANDDGTVNGTVGYEAQRQALVKVLTENGVQDSKINVTALEGKVPSSKKWAIVKLATASLRTQGKHSSEMATQAIMGQPLRVLEIGDEWCRVQCPDDYIAYIPESSITYLTQETFDAWRASRRCIVTAHSTWLTEEPGSENVVSDLVLGNILELKGLLGDSLLVATPDGREGWLDKAHAENLDIWKMQELDTRKVESTARRMMGCGYLWGGTSTKVTDCSGLTKVCYFACGIILQRDASQQALYGIKIDKEQWREARLGDLLFFGNSKGRVTHVGIYLRDGKYIHCSGQVKINSLDPSNPLFIDKGFLSIRRVNGMVGTKGITRVRDHSWFF